MMVQWSGIETRKNWWLGDGDHNRNIHYNCNEIQTMIMLKMIMICIWTKKGMILIWSEWQQEIWECQTNTKEFEWCWWWRWFCKISARFNNNYNTHLKSDNDDGDEENQMELVKTQWVQIKMYIVRMI